MAQGKKTPTKTKVLQGTFEKCKSLENEFEPKLVTEMPPPPNYFGEKATEVYYRVGRELVDKGVITDVDLESFAAYCRAVEQWEAGVRTLAKEGYVLKTKTGYVQPHPMVSITNQLADQIKVFGSMFGLNPTGRLKVPQAAVKNANRFEILKNKKAV